MKTADMHDTKNVRSRALLSDSDMPSRDPYLDTIFSPTSELLGISEYLERLGRAFRMTGNTKVSEEMSEIAKDIDRIQKSISGAVGNEINDRCKQSEAETGEVLKLVIGGLLR